MPAGDKHSTPPQAQSARAFSWWATILAAAIIALAAIAAYQNSFAGAFLLDDNVWIVENTSIRHLWPIWPLLFPPNTTMVSGRPLVSFTLAVNYALGGTNVWGYHAVNLAIHVLAAWTLFGIARRTLMLPRLREQFGAAATPLALAATLVWTVHPLQTAAVTYVIQRTEALVGLFYLLTLYCVIRDATSTSRTIWWRLAATMACLLGMATKEVMATAPVIVLLYDRTFLAGSFREALRRRTGLYLALAATWSVIAWSLISTGFHDGTTGFAVRKFTWWSYLLTQPGVLVHYLRLVFWPSGLCLDYGWPAARTAGEIVFPAIFGAGLFGLTVWALVKRSAWGFLGAWFFIVLAPTSSFVPILDAAFEHRMYLPLAAVAVGLAAGGYLASRRLIRTPSPALPIVGGSLTIFTCVVLGILTFQRNVDYSSDLLIWEDTVAKAPRNERAQSNLGAALALRGLFDEALVCYRKALEIKPDFAEAHYNLGVALARRGQVDEAIAHYRQVLKIKPDFADAHNNLGNALADRGQVDEAVAYYRKALEIKPDFAGAHNNLGMALAGRGQDDEAIAHYRKSLEIMPDYAGVHYNLGKVLAGRGQVDEAMAHYRKALEIMPDYAEAHHSLGVILAERGQVDEAVAHFGKALEIKPDFAKACNNLAWLLATCSEASIRNGAEAVELAKRAVQLTNGQDPAMLDTLSAAYAEAGQFPEAMEASRKALDLATQQNKKALVESIKAMIRFYEAGKPFREAQPPSPAHSAHP